MTKFCIVGDIYNDVTLRTESTPLKMRLGGIVHAARCMYALGQDYSVAYFAPSYLDEHIKHYLTEIECKEVIKLGNVTNSPNTVLIEEVKEVGNQGYSFLLNENINMEYYDSEFSKLNDFDNILLFAGKFSLSKIMSSNRHAKFHIDVTNDIKKLEDLEDNHFRTIFLSTSSDLFKSSFIDYTTLTSQLNSFCDQFVLKENRGGSRSYNYTDKNTIFTPAIISPIVHSVGVGDVFDTIVSYYDEKSDFEANLLNASYIASEYAQTTFIGKFKRMANHYVNLPIADKKNLGISLPWERRKDIHIYIAAPDFDFIDKKPIDFIYSALTYHNFTPHRPIEENGQMPDNASLSDRQRIFQSDMQLLDKCQIMIVILLYNDPGTLIEIGLAKQRKMPVLVYDYHNSASNCMLTELPDIVTDSADEIITELFKFASKI